MFVAVLSGLSAATQVPQNAQAWLARVPALPTSAEAAYSLWTDTGGVLKPGSGLESVREGIRSQTLLLSRPVATAPGSEGSLSHKDQLLADKIAVFPDTAHVQQSIQAARTLQAAISQRWQADLQALERRRLLERSALPACHNVAGAPSQAAIRDVEMSYAKQRITLAAEYLQQFQPVMQQLLGAVSPRIAQGDAAIEAWSRLNNPGARGRLAPAAHAAETDALADVGLLNDFVQEASKTAARAVADRNALGRVYAQAAGC